MPSFNEVRELNFTPEQLFNIVADIEKYPEFLPWCAGARIHERTESLVKAELLIKFGLLSESYTSEVRLTPYELIKVRAIKGPFRHLTNEWRFEKIEKGTRLSFAIDFKFNSLLLERTISKVFELSAKKMCKAFEKRAKEIYSNL